MGGTNYMYLVLSNARQGQDEEFNHWYTNRHVPDVLMIPGVVGAVRYRLAPAQRKDPPYAYQYMTLYEIEPAAAERVMHTLARESGTATMPVSDSFAPGHLPLVFEPITERITPQR